MIEGGFNGQELAADSADFRIDLSGVHKSLNKIREQQDVGIQGKHPFAVTQIDCLILSGCEADIRAVIDNLATIFELLEDVDRTVCGSVVDDDDFFVLVLLSKYGFKTSFYEAA